MTSDSRRVARVPTRSAPIRRPFNHCCWRRLRKAEQSLKLIPSPETQASAARQSIRHENITMSRSARAGEQLLRTPPPQPDESLMGYILRLAESNYYATPKWILDLAGLKVDNLRNGWRKLCDDRVDFTLFKQITRLSEEEVNEMKHEIISESDYERCDAQWDVPINSLRF